MNNHRETIDNITRAFDNNDVEAILNEMADDVEWHMLGDKPLTGKDEIRHMLTRYPNMKVISCTRDHIIINGDNAAVDGIVECTDRDGRPMEMYYCDIYELSNERVVKMISYTVPRKR